MAKDWDQSRFNNTLRTYLQVCSRTFAQAINTKAYYVARKGVWFTKKADTWKMRRQLGGIVVVPRQVVRKGVVRTVKTRRLQLVNVKTTRGSAPLAALILQKRAGDAGHASEFFGRSLRSGRAAMAKAVRSFLAMRDRSAAFIKSGWLEAIRKLAPLADKKNAPAIDTSAKQRGRSKGDCRPAQDGMKAVAEIVNLALGAKHDRSYGTNQMKVATEGLQIAFDDEAASMDDYIREKMRPDAEKFNREQK